MIRSKSYCCSEFRCPPSFNQNAMEQEDHDDDCTSLNSSLFLRKNGINQLVSCVNSVLESSYNDNLPFHGHSVTKLMRNALVGNTRSYMIVALSPSELAYQRTIFILKFAERVRMLSTRAIINEEVTSKLIRELKGENEKLRKLISLGDFESNDLSSRLLDGLDMASPSSRDAVKRKIVDDLKGQVRENEKEIRNLQQSLDERLKAFKMEKNDVVKRVESDRKSKCHLFNLSSDSQITGRIILIIPLGTIDFGHLLANGKGKEHFISFCGPGIQDHHGTFTYNPKDGKFSIKPSGPNSKILVNETPIQFDTVLGSNDRVVLGGSQAWVFQNPKETWIHSIPCKFHFQDILEEAARKSESFKTLARHFESMPDCQKNELLRLLPCIEDAKMIAEDLNQNVMIYPVLQQPVELFAGAFSDEKATSQSDNAIEEADEDNGKGRGSTILVKVQNLVDGTFHYWSVAKFHDRLELLKGSYVQFLEDRDVPLKELEAFRERSDPDVPIGYSILSMKPIAYLMNIDNPTLSILDYISYQPIGSINVSLCFSDADSSSGGRLNDLEVFIETPDELLDQTLELLITIQNLQFNHQFKEVYCKYKFLSEDEETITKVLDAKASNFITGQISKYERRISLGPVTDNTLNLLLTQCLVLRFFGKQRTHKLLNLVENVQNESYFRGSTSPVEMELTLSQLKIKEKSELRHQRRLNAFKALVEQSEALGEESIPLNFMKSLFRAKSQDLVNQSLDEHKELLAAIPEEPHEEEKQLPPELKALKRFSEICSIF